jgi:hypothetical protein
MNAEKAAWQMIIINSYFAKQETELLQDYS